MSCLLFVLYFFFAELRNAVSLGLKENYLQSVLTKKFALVVIGQNFEAKWQVRYAKKKTDQPVFVLNYQYFLYKRCLLNFQSVVLVNFCKNIGFPQGYIKTFKGERF